jgi:hypothetical protein
VCPISAILEQVLITLESFSLFFKNMPNQRQIGTKLAGAYISAEKDKALAKLAALKGHSNKADFIRVLFDKALSDAALCPTKDLRTTKNKK